MIHKLLFYINYKDHDYESILTLLNEFIHLASYKTIKEDYLVICWESPCINKVMLEFTKSLHKLYPTSTDYRTIIS